MPTSTEQHLTSLSKINPTATDEKINSISKPGRNASLSHLRSASIDRSQGRMATLAELYPDEQMVTDEDAMNEIPVSEDLSSDKNDEDLACDANG